MNRGIIGAVAAVVVAVIIAAGSWYTVDQTERGVLLRYGAVIGTAQPGLGFKVPLIDSVEKVSVKTTTYTWDKMNSYSYDQQPADLKISVTLRASPDKVSDLYAKFGRLETAVNQVVSPVVNQQVKVVFGRYTAVKAIQERGAAQQRDQGRHHGDAERRSDDHDRKRPAREHRIQRQLSALDRTAHAGRGRGAEAAAERRARESSGADHRHAGNRQGQRGPRRGAGQRRSARGSTAKPKPPTSGSPAKPRPPPSKPAPRRSAPIRTSSRWCRPNAGTAYCRPRWCRARPCRSCRSNRIRIHQEARMPGIAISGIVVWRFEILTA